MSEWAFLVKETRFRGVLHIGTILPGRLLRILVVAHRGSALACDCDGFRHGLRLDEIVVFVLFCQAIDCA
jgi:hypothetical protein